MKTLRTTNLYSNDLSCPSCIGKIEGRLAALNGVVAHACAGRVQ